MRILLLGVGLQGKVALYDLVKSDVVKEIIAADYQIEQLKKYVAEKQLSKVKCKFFDANEQGSIEKLVAEKPDVIIDLLPVQFMEKIAEVAIENKIHLVNTFYVSQRIKELASAAEKNQITILPEFGMDPGIDLVLLGEAIKGFETIEVINSYGAGLPELEIANNPLKYKITWTFEGVLRSYFRAGKIIRNGKITIIKENEMFNPENIHSISIDSVGKLEAFPNGDALKYLEIIGITTESNEFKQIKQMARFTMRWPGHSEFWKKLVDLHFLDEEPIEMNGQEINRRKFLAKILEPHLQLQPHEKDIMIILLEIEGIKDGKKTRATHLVIDRKDLQTGFTAMSRAVGFTASIGAQLVGSGRIQKRGVLSPVKDIPFEILRDELINRGIYIKSSITEIKENEEEHF